MGHTSSPWEAEPDTIDFVSSNLQCAMRRGPIGHWCGYVAVPEGHPLHGLHYDHDDLSDVSAHGGITYAEDHLPAATTGGKWWFGFDCAHSGDWVPGLRRYADDVYRDVEYVHWECRNLAKQLAAIAKAKREA